MAAAVLTGGGPALTGPAETATFGQQINSAERSGSLSSNDVLCKHCSVDCNDAAAACILAELLVCAKMLFIPG